METCISGRSFLTHSKGTGSHDCMTTSQSQQRYTYPCKVDYKCSCSYAHMVIASADENTVINVLDISDCKRDMDLGNIFLCTCVHTQEFVRT